MFNKKKWTLAFKIFVCFLPKQIQNKQKKDNLLIGFSKEAFIQNMLLCYVFYLIFGEVLLLVLVPFCLHRFELHLTRANKTKNIIIHVIKIITEILSLICYISKTWMPLTILGSSRKTKENIFVVQNHLWERLGNVKKMNKNTFVPYAIKQSNQYKVKSQIYGTHHLNVLFCSLEKQYPWWYHLEISLFTHHNRVFWEVKKLFLLLYK